MAVGLLVLFGLVAAVCAMLIVQALTAPDPEAVAEAQAEPEVQILVAKQALPAMSVVDGDSVTVEQVPRGEAPAGALQNPVQVVGKVLALPVVAGQAFTARSFARDDSAVHLAAALPHGKRAVTVSLTDHAGLSGLLYPGSVVDVLASIRMESEQDGQSDEATTTLLQGLQVLAVGDETVVSSEEALAGRRTPSRLVALLVDPKQAQVLQLAMAHGSVSLAMRNPLDGEKPTTPVTTWLSEISRQGQPPRQSRADDETIRALRAALAEARARPAAAPNTAVSNDTPPEPEPHGWEVLIIRGGDKETLELPLPESASAAQAPAG
ncbi:MAG: Flp pilus assembly protein CpaB [Phycisphaeraceae bacterium]